MAVFELPKSPPDAGAAVVAGLVPNIPPLAGALVAAGCVAGAVVAAGLAPNKDEVEVDCCAPALPNKPVPAGLDTPGGAPAGVVEASENMGFAGVAAVAAVGAEGDALGLFPNRELPVLAKRPDAGAAEVVVVLEAWVVLF